MELTTDQKGAIAELAIASEAAALGVGVLKPLNYGERYDLIFDLRPELMRVQCKWAVRLGEWFRSGVRAPGVARAGCLPISLVDARRSVYLRLSPARNNQVSGVNFAEDYRLGAIAQLGERPAGSRKVGGSNPPSSTGKAARAGRLLS